MEESFRRVVQHVFENWTALNIALEQSDAYFKYKEIVAEFVNYMVQYCLYTPNLDVANIQEALDDIMDQEFETICEDNSTKEIATILYQFVDLTKQKDLMQFDAEYKKLPVSETRSDPNRVRQAESSNDGNSSTEIADTPMEESEWIEVKSKRKKFNN